MTTKETISPHIKEFGFLNGIQQRVYTAIRRQLGPGIEIFYQKSTINNKNNPPNYTESRFSDLLRGMFGNHVEIEYQPVEFVRIWEENGIPRVQSTVPDFFIEWSHGKTVFVEITQSMRHGEEDEKRKQKNIMKTGFGSNTVEDFEIWEDGTLNGVNGKDPKHAIFSTRILTPQGQMTFAEVKLRTNGGSLIVPTEYTAQRRKTEYVVLYGNTLLRMQSKYNASLIEGAKTRRLLEIWGNF